MHRFMLIVVFGLLISGCVTPIPFNTVSLGGEPTVTSEKGASLLHVSGAVGGATGTTMMSAGGIYVPISTGPVPYLQFHAENQSEFIDVLREELLRLKVFSAISLGAGEAGDDFRISVIFTRTYHRSYNQEYTLDVVMHIEGGSKPFIKEYRVNSNEKSTLWQRWNTDAYEGKVLAVHRLLERLIPDIQAYVDENV